MAGNLYRAREPVVSPATADDRETMTFHRRIALSAVLTGLLCGAAAGPAGAVTAEVSGTTLRVTGGQAGERIGVSLRTLDEGRIYTVFAADALTASTIDVVSGPGCVPPRPDGLNGEPGAAICAAPPIQAVEILGLGGGDDLGIEPERPGFDQMVVPVRVDGGAGSDKIEVDTNPSRATGGAGNDRIGRRCGPGRARLTGGAGNDVIAACDSGTPDRAAGPVKVIAGGPGQDSLDGSAGRDRMTGGPGIDGVYGRAGRDRLDGGAGADQLLGDKGNDRLFGRGGKDGLVDHQGDNVLIGAAGDDALFTLSAVARGEGSSRVVGGVGDDFFYIRNRRRDRASGGAGEDSAVADGIDVMRSIESSLTRIPQIPGVPRF
jgi:Ca2+-binding RTX toxin-like protein